MYVSSISRALRTVFLLLGLAATLQACTGIRPGYEMPAVTVSSFRALPSEVGLPNFEIGLHVVNPNSGPLKLRGVSYTINLDGHELVNGVANDLPVIDAYGQGDIKVTAAANLFAGIRFVRDLMSESKENIDYEFVAKLDVGALLPAIRVKDSGQISLRGATAN